jgi:hypothetical protein
VPHALDGYVSTTLAEGDFKMYSKKEEGIQNAVIREAIYQNRVELEQRLRIMRLWLIGLAAIFAVTCSILSVTLYQISREEPQPIEEAKAEITEVVEEIVAEQLAPLTPQPGTLSSEEIKNRLVNNFTGHFSFDFIQVETKNRSGFTNGRTSCDETGFVYTYDQVGYMPDMERGIWITVSGCGLEGNSAKEAYGDFAKLYMPYEAMARVYTFQDYIVAIKEYAVLYQINQPALSELLGVNLDSLPPNQVLPEHPYMDN